MFPYAVVFVLRLVLRRAPIIVTADDAGRCRSTLGRVGFTIFGMGVETGQLALSSYVGMFDVGAVWATLGAVWYRALLATGLLVFACCAGWGISRSESLAPVQFVRWWVRRVVLPLLRSPSWFVRSAVIYVNNMLILSALVGLGRWSWGVIAGTVAVGVAMGIAVRTLSSVPELNAPEVSGDAVFASRRARWGMALNLLEPPAIAMALGLALSAEPESLTAVQVWGAFFVVVAPMMLAAACGESLWMGESGALAERAEPVASEDTDSRARDVRDHKSNSDE